VKTDGALQMQAVAWAKRMLWPMGVALVAISAATPLVHPTVAAKWFGVPQVFALLPVPLACAVAFFAVRWVLTHPDLVRAGHGWIVFAATVVIFVLAFFGLAYSIFPDIVIGRMTVWEAAISTASLNVVFVGVTDTLPVIVGDTVFTYRVFWGKARALTYGSRGRDSPPVCRSGHAFCRSGPRPRKRRFRATRCLASTAFAAMGRSYTTAVDAPPAVEAGHACL
jgi:cytochrome d ubiquinol oxidase subunit II